MTHLQRLPLAFRSLSAVATALLLSAAGLLAQEFVWEEEYARFVPPNDLQWQPRAFEFEAGDTVRYIDYESGSDSNSGTSSSSPWKHHPWDGRATGNAKAFEGIATYVFKRGVHYRLEPGVGNPAWVADDSGEPGNPIRLTSSPEWGSGFPVIAGSVPIEQEWQRAGQGDVPERMDVSDQTVWYVDLEAPPYPGGRGKMEVVLFEVRPDGGINNLYLASDVGWELQNHNFALHHWNTWDEYRRMGTGRGKKYKDEALAGKPRDYYDGGTIWSQYAWVIANPTPDPIEPGDYDPRGFMEFKKGSEPVNPGTRYLIEDLPQFLDQPGEYYYDDEMQRLFVRLHDERDPNRSRIELSTAVDVLHITGQSHIEISALAFRFNGRRKGPFWEDSHIIEATGNIEALTIKNCFFEYIGNDAINVSTKPNQHMGVIRVTDCSFNWVNGGTGIEINGGTASNNMEPTDRMFKVDRAEVLRNRATNMGLYRHDDHKWSNVQAINSSFSTELLMAGNIVDMTWGSGLVSQGGMGGKDIYGFDFPLIRYLIFQNKTENNALAVNDYGGMSLWQHGSIYAFSNIVGNSVGFWPGGFFNSGDGGLSYPIYLDGGFKIFVFNNITWAHPYGSTVYGSDKPAFFNVFGFMNPFVNNTVYGNGEGLGGTSGNRNDYLGNLFASVNKTFISVNHGGNPSLIGGDDDASSGIDGASTLAFGQNLFNGKAKAGVVASVKRGAKKDVDADTIPALRKQMQDYPMRFAQLGEKDETFPLTRGLPEGNPKPGAGDMDLRPAADSAAIDAGIKYFIPWALYGTVGEWYFNANHADPALVLDYHYYPSVAHFNRSMYHMVPAYELRINNATLEDYTESNSETWNLGALVFDGSRYGSVDDAGMKNDLRLPISQLNPKAIKNRVPWKPWRKEGDAFVLPAEERHTLDLDTTNVLVEAILRTNQTRQPIAGKHDGNTGYRLYIDPNGKVVFQISSDGNHGAVVSSSPINNGEWVHVIGEIDRESGAMSIYVDGQPAGQSQANLNPQASLSNSADFIVGADNSKQHFLTGAIDFLRVSTGTLEDAKTSIEELYAWQFDGPVLRDFAGREPTGGGRDIGALER